MTDFLKQFDHQFGPMLGMREPTFRAVLREMSFRGHQNIVETGTMRKSDNWAGDGQSSIIWNEYRKWNGQGQFYTFDKDKAACDLANEACPGAIVQCGDSVQSIKMLPSAFKIDVLYLDSFDYEKGFEHEAALHAMMELTVAMPHLRPGSIIFVDDSPMSPDFEITGKGTYVAMYMKHIGARPFAFAYQVAWLFP